MQNICVGLGVDIDAVVCGHLASGAENILVNCRNLASSEIRGFRRGGETTSGQLRVKTSRDWRCYIDMVKIQNIKALAEVWLAAWPLTMSNTARGGRQQQILVF